MKDFREWRHEANLFNGSNLSETDFAHLKECYDAGAEEKLKSLRCETCRFNECSYRSLAVRYNEEKDFGCIHWSKK
jgi:hypothetical protein